jgi:ABC-2 type transport system ATP-binding protein
MSISCRGVVAGYGGTRVLDGVDLELDAGVVAILGANGAGKSTLLGVLATLLPTTGGAVRVAGVDLGGRGGRRRVRASIGFLPQRADLPGDFRVRDALAYAAWLQRVPRSMRDEVIARTVEALQLEPLLGERLRTLSGGTKQRVLLAFALVHDPPVVLLDEPFVGIDATHRAEFRQLLADVGRERLVVFSTHGLDDVELVADRVVVLDRGRVVYDGGVEELAATGDRPDTSGVERPLERALRELAREAQP